MPAPPSRNREVAATALTIVLALPARAPADEVGRMWMRLVDRVASRWDLLFDALVRSERVHAAVRATHAWGSWIANGLATGFLAALVATWIARRPLSWRGVGVALGVWALVRAAWWNWDRQYLFGSIGSEPTPWPLAGSLGFLWALGVGFTLGGRPWRSGVRAEEVQ